MASIDFDEKVLSIFDSYHGALKKYAEICADLKGYIEYLAESKFAAPWSEWRTVCNHDIPKQTNNKDCGVFVCALAAYRSQGRALDYTEEDMVNFRKMITLTLCKTK